MSTDADPDENTPAGCKAEERDEVGIHRDTAGETILIVDDEEAILRLVASYLGTRGYAVLTAGGGEEAVAVATDTAMPPIDLLFTDIAMPGMRGDELGAKLGALQPGIRILYTSGQSFAVADGQANDGAGFIQKPYRLDELERRIGETLDQRIR